MGANAPPIQINRLMLSSLGGYQSGPGFGVYCASKFAVEGLTEALHGELAPLGIHATVFAFGMNDENLHAPNEFFRLSNFRTGQTAYCKLLERLG